MSCAPFLFVNEVAALFELYVDFVTKRSPINTAKSNREVASLVISLGKGTTCYSGWRLRQPLRFDSIVRELVGPVDGLTNPRHATAKSINTSNFVAGLRADRVGRMARAVLRSTWTRRACGERWAAFAEPRAYLQTAIMRRRSRAAAQRVHQPRRIHAEAAHGHRDGARLATRINTNSHAESACSRRANSSLANKLKSPEGRAVCRYQHSSSSASERAKTLPNASSGRRKTARGTPQN